MALDERERDKLKQKGFRLRREGKPDEALRVFLDVVAREPNDLASWTQVAELATARSNVGQAVFAYQKIAARYAKDGLFLKAASACKQILRLDPAHSQTQEMLATLYAGRRRPVPDRTNVADTLDGEMSPPFASRSAPTKEGNDTWRTASFVDLEITLPRVLLFSDVPHEALKDILIGMSMHEFADGAVIVAEGDVARSFFVLATGRVRVEKRSAKGPPIVLAHLVEGSFFGEMALLQGGPRTASVVADEASTVFEIGRDLLDEVVARYPVVQKALWRFYRERLLSTATATHPFFQAFSLSERRDLCQRFSARTFAQNETVIHEGTEGEGLFILLSGELAVSSKAQGLLARLHPGELVGEMSLLGDGRTRATVVAIKESRILKLARKDFHDVAKARPAVRELLVRIREGRTAPTIPGTSDDIGV